MNFTKHKINRVRAIILFLCACVVFFLYPATLLSILPVFVLFGIMMQLIELEQLPKGLLQVIGILFTVVMLFYAIETLAGGAVFERIKNNPLVFSIEFLLLVSMVLLCYSITGNTTIGLRVTTIFSMVYGLVTYFTFAFRGTVFVPQDILAAKTALSVLPNYKFTLEQPLLTSVLIFVFAFVLAGKLKLPKITKYDITKSLRIGSLVFAFLIGYNLEVPNRIAGVETTPHYWDLSISAYNNGSLINFITVGLDSIVREPDGYTAQQVETMAQQYPSDAVMDAQQTPDIVVIMGESWADITPDTIPFMKSLANRENSIYQPLVISSFGGGTSYNEYQVLTGTSGVYGVHSAPFQNNTYEGLPNLTAQLKQLGYETTAMHTGTLEAWGRDKAFPMLGFDRFLSGTELKQPESLKTRGYLSDSVLYDEILRQLDSAQTPQFVYAITIQTHGGYETEGYQSTVSIEGNYPQAEQYATLMKEADTDFEALIKALETRSRPTIVLAYGDHLPLVEVEYMNNQRQASQNKAWDFETFFVMWSNKPLSTEIPQTVSSNYLSAYLVKNAGLPLTGYQKFLLDSAQSYPVISPVGYFDAQNNFASFEEINSTVFYQTQNYLQYNLLHDFAHAPQNFFTLKE